MARLWTIAVIAEAFHVLPSAVARDLDDDPEMVSLECFHFLQYAKAYADFDSDGDEAVKRWKGSALMDEVTANTFAMAKARAKGK